ncbi:hypothetical protein, partial [Vibrio parahaemolyticus]|uniref:hypothetical protein n=2 Tax=Vibrionaceae TaxID=641 RepID=UPI00146E5A1D
LDLFQCGVDDVSDFFELSNPQIHDVLSPLKRKYLKEEEKLSKASERYADVLHVVTAHVRAHRRCISPFQNVEVERKGELFSLSAYAQWRHA